MLTVQSYSFVDRDMFMRFLGIGIGHCGQHTTVEVGDITGDYQARVTDEESNDDEENADFEDEEDEDIVDEEDSDCDDDFGYGDL